jgi:hypothetical protein
LHLIRGLIPCSRKRYTEKPANKVIPRKSTFCQAAQGSSDRVHYARAIRLVPILFYSSNHRNVSGFQSLRIVWLLAWTQERKANGRSTPVQTVGAAIPLQATLSPFESGIWQEPRLHSHKLLLPRKVALEFFWVECRNEVCPRL